MKTRIIGVASSKFGELWDVSPRSLIRSVVSQALKDANLEINDIDGLYVGNMLSGMLGNQENLGALFAEELGMKVAGVKVEGACASGGLAMHSGVCAIESGMYKRILVVGVEKMTDHKPEMVAGALMAAGSESERLAGLTFPGLYGLIAQSYMKHFSVTEENLAYVSVKNHYHGSLNPNAHYRNQVSVDQVLKSPCIADPLKLLDCSPISDGASAVVLCSADTLSKNQHPIKVIGSSAAIDTLGLSERRSLTTLSATVRAAQNAYKQAQCSPSDISVAEVHDCFSIAELIALEDLHFYDSGKSARAVMDGEATLGSSKHRCINTSGGLKACGHPVGATGVKQIVEVVEQLLGRAGKRQVSRTSFGLTHNVGGSGAVAVVRILTN